MEEFWNDLKRAHFVDSQTRAIIITVPVSSNNIGARARVSLVMETISTGAVLPSFITQASMASGVSGATAASMYSEWIKQAEQVWLVC